MITEVKEGELWKYDSREGEEESYVVIRKIEEDDRLGCIIHVSIKNVSLKSKNTELGVLDSIGHSPFSDKALLPCLIEKLDGIDSDDGWEEGYGMWKEGFDAGKAGIYSISIKDSVERMESILAQQEAQDD